MSPTLHNDEGKGVIPSPLLLGASAVLLLAYIIRTVLSRPPKLDFPVVGSPDDPHFRAALLEGTAKYPHTPYILPGKPEIVILPMKTHDEMRNVPETKASFQQEVSRNFLGDHTGIGEDLTPLIKVIKSDLTRHVASTIDALQDESRFSLEKELGACENWTEFVLYEKLIRMVALLSGRVFVGRPVSRSEEWLKISINYTVDVGKATERANYYPAWIRPIVTPFFPEIRNIKEYQSIGAKLLKPIIEGCIDKFKTGKALGEKEDEFDDVQGTFVSWIMKWSQESKRFDPFALSQQQLTLSFVSIHTTTMALTHALNDLAAHPQYIAPLREEIERVLEEDGYEDDGNSGLKNLKKSSLPKLKKLDSFLKESQRFSPVGLVVNSRLATSDIHLSTGHTIPKGSRFAYDVFSINEAGPDLSLLHDSTVPAFDPPDVFSPFRWSTLRETPGNESKYQLVTTSKESMNFGHGSHACPGRFFAGVEMKVLMVEILKNWDFRFPGDLNGEGGERPGNHIYEITISPDAGSKMEFRRRSV